MNFDEDFNKFSEEYVFNPDEVSEWRGDIRGYVNSQYNKFPECTNASYRNEDFFNYHKFTCDKCMEINCLPEIIYHAQYDLYMVILNCCERHVHKELDRNEYGEMCCEISIKRSRMRKKIRHLAIGDMASYFYKEI